VRCRDLEFGVRIGRSGIAGGTGGAARTAAEHKSRKCKRSYQHTWATFPMILEACDRISGSQRQTRIHMVDFRFGLLGRGETDAARIYCGGLEIPIDVAGDDRWQAELCAEFEAARSDGASDAQRSIANGQRVRNRQPEGGFRGSGNSPRTNAFRRLRRSSSMCGAAARSACV